MKREYVKPQFGVDVFTLSQAIALDCGRNPEPGLGSPTISDPDQCEWVLGEGDDGLVYFSYSNEDCEYEFENGDVEGFCYNYPAGEIQIFGS